MYVKNDFFKQIKWENQRLKVNPIGDHVVKVDFEKQFVTHHVSIWMYINVHINQMKILPKIILIIVHLSNMWKSINQLSYQMHTNY